MRNKLRKVMSILLTLFVMFSGILPAATAQATENISDIANGAMIENDFDSFEEWLANTYGDELNIVVMETPVSQANGFIEPVDDTVGLSSDLTPQYGPNKKFIADIGAPDLNAIKIYTAEDLDNIRKNLSGSYVLMNDIDLADFNSGQWVPIGDNSTSRDTSRFTGTFDGQGYVISNLTITGNLQYAGLFGYLSSGAAVKNVGLENSDISTPFTYAGGICGYAYGSVSISNCYNIGYVSAVSTSVSTTASAYAGGICGYVIGNVDGKINISNCYNTGDVTVSSASSLNAAYAGGIFGYADNNTMFGVNVSNCYNTGNVSAASSTTAYAGGIYGSIMFIGENEFSVSNCYNTGNVSAAATSSTANAYAGGICGHLNDFVRYDGVRGDISVSFSNCYNTGDVSAAAASSKSSNAYAGGIYGYGGGGYYDFSFSIDNSYNTGDISASTITDSSTHAYAGGICGFTGGSGNISIGNCYNTGDVYASAPSYYGSEYAGGICGETNGGSVIISNCYNTGDVSASTDAGGICGSVKGKISISFNSCYNTGDVSLSVYAGGICGFVDGARDCSISISNCYNIAVVSALLNAGGICGDVVGGNVSVSSSYNIGEIISAVYAGGICARINVIPNAAAISNNDISISNCYNTGDVSASALAGGICGEIGGSIKVSDCYNIGNVSSAAPERDFVCAGGIFGSIGYVDGNHGNGSVIISNCYNMGNVSAAAPDRKFVYAGGICGYAYGENVSIKVNHCYNAGAVSSVAYNFAYAGGICGYADNFDNISFSDCHNIGAVTSAGSAGGICSYTFTHGSGKVSNCYNTGDVSASYVAGGIWGSFYSSDYSISNCYWNIESAQIINGISRENKDKKGMETDSETDSTTPLTSVQMKDKNSFKGFDFDDVWDISAEKNDGYPILRVFDYDNTPAWHKIIVSNGGNGIANANVTAAVSGAAIKLEAIANNGYNFKEWQVISGPITLSSTTANPVTFTMPNNTVEVKAIFEAKPGGGGDSGGGGETPAELLLPPADIKNPSGVGVEAILDLWSNEFVMEIGGTVFEPTKQAGGYSVNGGEKWISKKAFPGLEKLLDTKGGMELWIADKMTANGKEPAADATVIKFPKIQQRDKANKEGLGLYYPANTPGCWWLSDKKDKPDSKPNGAAEGYQYAKADDKGKLPAEPVWNAFPMDGVALDIKKATYYVRTSGKITLGSTDIYIPASKMFKVTPALTGKQPKHKIDYGKELLNLKQYDAYKFPGSAGFTTVELKKLSLNLDAALTTGGSISVKKVSTGKKPETAEQTIALAGRATLAAKTLDHTKLATELKDYEIWLENTSSPSKSKWGKLPKITKPEEFDIRLKSTAKVKTEKDGSTANTGKAASTPGKLVIEYSNGAITSAKIIV